MKLICPKCGSIKVTGTKKLIECLETDCKHVGPRSERPATTTYHQPNQHWRDPVAMSMDGYDN